jgi:hypothetical protein
VTELDVQQQNALLFLFYCEGGRRLTLGMMLPIPFKEGVFGVSTSIENFLPSCTALQDASPNVGLQKNHSLASCLE